MPRTVSREVLQGFLEEAQSYLPTILKLIDVFRADPKRSDALQELYRLVHTIKGASGMVGLAGLSHIAYLVEEALGEIAAGQRTLSAEWAALLCRTVEQIKAYIDAVTAGTLVERPMLIQAEIAFRRMRGLPQWEDENAIRQMLAEIARQTSTPVVQESKTKSQSPTPAPVVPELRSKLQPSAPAPVSVLPEEPIPPELAEAFFMEAEDHLRQISTRLIDLEKQPDDKNALQDIRRGAHTLKGAAGAVGFNSIMQLTHRMEDLLDLLYEGEMEVTPEAIQLLFASTDVLEDLHTGGFDEATMQSTLQDLYARYTVWLGPAAAKAEEQPEGPVEVPAEATFADIPGMGAQEHKVEPAAVTAVHLSGQVVRAPIERLDELVRLVGEVAISRTTFEQRMSDFVRMVSDLRESVERMRRVSTNLETQYEASALGGNKLIPAFGGAAPRFSSATAKEFDALEFDRYTEFHRLSRELAETTSDIRTIGNELGVLTGDFDGILVRQSRLTSELQDKLMRVRMVPLSTLATRLHRAVRTIAHDQGKSVELVLQGEHIELDKTVLEEMADPLLHLLRNAVDHGIESPARRHAAGKPETGNIFLKASQEGNQIVIQVSDDGAGLDPHVLRTAAVRGGFVSEIDASQLTDDDLYSMVFLPGFSTSTEVSQISGRGVGLDIVKTNVYKLKGTVTVHSKPGQGATFTIRLPMTLAVMRALLVKANNETFAIPQNAISQILRLEHKEIERIGRDLVVRMGGRVYPVMRLGEVLKLKQPPDETAERVPVLLVNTGGEQVALVVDHLLTGREIVIKTLGSHLRRVQGITGATLMGDGTVVLIVNPLDLPTETKLESRTLAALHPSGASAIKHEAWSIMIVDDSVSVRRVVSNLIRSTGWQPITAKDGLEALEILQRSIHTPDLILLDIEMPRMDGFELMATLKSQAVYRNIPVVILTSRAGAKHQHKALELGASEYVVKPYQDETLLRVIKRLVLESKKSVAA